ncbi:MAG: histidine phosphatase family protein [Clostridia bacterium]|nr:histidine phosphatase family protein [Clostridia bacterium]
MKLIFLRHGESEANGKKFFAGHTDVGLSPRGKKQAELAAKYIKENFDVDKIYSSDLSRAYETALPLALSLGLEICKDARLREIYGGKWEGKTFDELEKLYPETYRIWLDDIGHARPDGGESAGELSERIYSAVKDIAEKNEGKTVVIATHATPIRAVFCLAAGEGTDGMKDVPWVANASVSVFDYENGRFTALTAGEDAYLEALKTTFPANV